MKQKKKKSPINESNKRILLFIGVALAAVIIAAMLFNINRSNNNERRTGEYQAPVNSGEPDFIEDEQRGQVDTADNLNFQLPKPKSITERNRRSQPARTQPANTSQQANQNKPNRRQQLYEEALASDTKIGGEIPLNSSTGPSANSSMVNQVRSQGQSYSQTQQNNLNQQQVSQENQGTVDLKHPATPYTLLEGSMVEATLQYGISSALPGDIIGIINRDIYDSIHQNYLLIPRGSRLIGTYDSGIAFDQRKMMMSWDRIIFPDGRSMPLPEVPTHDLQGMSGLGGDVNTHFWRIFGQSAMLSLIGAGASVAIAPNRSGLFGQTSARELIAAQVAQDFQRVANTVLRRNLNRQPTIEIPSGTAFKVFLLNDISFEEPYTYTEAFSSK